MLDPQDVENMVMISIALCHLLTFMISLVYFIYVVKHKDNDICEQVLILLHSSAL